MGRSAQKARTRTSIIAAARELERTSGRVPGIEDAADAAGVSRATAYRYFPTQQALEVELDSGRLWAGVEELVAGSGRELDALIDAIVDAVRSDEAHVRTALRVYHDTWLRDPDAAPVRRGRRQGWIAQVLDGRNALTERQRHRLQQALALVVGPDPVLMLKDVAGLTGGDAAATLKWAAAALVRAALTED